MSRDFDSFRLMVSVPSVARPMATSLSQYNGVGGWGVPHVVQDLALVCCYPGGGEETSVLGLCYKRADDRDTRGVGRNGVIEWGVVVFVAEYAVVPGHTSGAGSGEIRSVRERAENHFGGPKNFVAVGVGGGISEEAVQSFHRVGRERSLLRGQGTGGGQEARVDGAAII